MVIVIEARNSTAAAQRVDIKLHNQAAILATVNIAAQTNVVLYTVPVAGNVVLDLICNGVTAQTTVLNVVYPGNSYVTQNSDWPLKWEVQASDDGLQLELSNS